MSGNIIGGIIGATIGFFYGGFVGALQGFAIGSAIGGALMPADLPTQYGPRLDDLKAQQSEYGSAIPIVYGTVALQGTVIWAADIKEVRTETEEGGGVSEPSQTLVNYTYFASFAVAVCEGPVSGFLRIWAGPEKRLIYDGSNIEGGQVRFYLGTEDQMPDPLIEASKGVGFTPAYRGTAYIVLEDFPLKNDFNRIPFLTIEVSTGSADTCPVPASSVVVNGQTYAIYDPAPVKIADLPPDADQLARSFVDAETGFYYYTYSTASGWFFNRINMLTGASGPPIGLGSASPKVAWNNLGQAVIIGWGGTIATRVDLRSWAYVQEPALSGIVTDGVNRVKVEIPVADVAWSDFDQEFQFLSYSNVVNGSYVGIYVIENVEIVVERAYGRFMHVTWGSTGERFSGELIPMWGAVAAAGFSNQPSNYATAAGVYWEAYDTKRHILMNFSGGSYAEVESLSYIDTSDFGGRGGGTDGRIVYSPYVDRYFVVEGAGIRVYDPEKLTPEHWPPEDCILYNTGVRQAYANGEPIATADFRMRLFLIPSQPDWLGVLLGTQVMKVYIGKQGRVKGTGMVLADVVADLSERAGMPHYDVVQLGRDIVDGYVIARQTEVQAAIQVLRNAYYFDACESQGVVKFVKRGGDVITIIDDADLAARDFGAEAPDPLKSTRRIENELPRAVTVKYLLAADDYNTATKPARRLIGASGDEVTLEVPLVLTDAKAQEVAQVNLHSAWVERISYSFTLSRKYSDLEPTDLVLVKGHLMRLTSVKASPRGVLECTALADETKYYAPNVVVSETLPNPYVLQPPGPTRLELF